MTEYKQSTSLQDGVTRRAVLVAQNIASNNFLFLVLGVYLAITTGTWQAYGVILLALEAVVGGFASASLIRRGNQELGSWVLLITDILAPALAAWIIADFSFVSIAYIAVSTFFIYTYVMPRDLRPITIATIGVGLVVPLVAVFVDVSWKLVSPAMLTVAPILTAILAVAFVVVIARQAWSGNIRLKIVTAFTIVALVSVGILGTVTYFNYRNQVREDIRQRLFNIVSLVAMNQDGDLHSNIQKPEDADDEAHIYILGQNVMYLATDPDLKYIYTMRKDEQGQIYFVINARQGGEPGDAIGTVYNEPSELLRTEFDTLSGPVVEEDIYTDIYGSVLPAYAPFYRSDGTREGIIGVDIDAAKIIASEQAVLRLILVTTAIAMVLVTILGLLLGNVFTKPIIHLSQVAQKITAGDLNARAEVETTDEVGDLAQTLNAMTSQLQATLQGLEQRVAARTKDLEIVAELGTATATILESKRLLQEVVDLTKERFNLYHSHIYLLDADGKNLVLTSGAGEPGRVMVSEGRSIPLDREQSLVARAARERMGVTVNDVTQAPDFLPNPLLPDTHSELAVPMIVGGNVIGVFDIQSEQVGRFTDADINIQTTLAAQLATSIQNVRSFEQSKRQAELQSLVNVIGSRIQRTTSIEETLQTAIRELGTAIGASRVKAKISARNDGSNN